jgi:hypothetical protein
MQSSYHQGSLQDTVVETYTIDPGSQAGFIYDRYGHSPLTFTTADNRSASIDNGTTNALHEIILGAIPQQLGQRTDVGIKNSSSPWDYFQQIRPYDVNTFLSNFTTLVTNTLRSATNGTQAVEGTAWATEQFVSIRWAWITLPVVLLFSSLLLVLITIIKSRRGGSAAWKSSVLATLLHGLTGDVRDQFRPGLSPSEIEVLSRQLRVKLKTDGGNTNISLA